MRRQTSASGEEHPKQVDEKSKAAEGTINNCVRLEVTAEDTIRGEL